MQKDFHYFATYCAAYLGGYSHEESVALCTAAQFVDLCTRTYLDHISGPEEAATTQLQLELADARMDILGRQDMTRIWSSFHFLPYDLYAEVKGPKNYKDKYRLICKPNGALLADTVKQVKGKGLAAAGIAMHILADTWAHSYFAGTPSLVINNTNSHFFEIIPDGKGGETERRVQFAHNPAQKEDLDKGSYAGCLYQATEHSIMSLGHGRAGHLPDYSCVKYRYLPAWGQYDEIIKDNPSDYMHAFCQMIYAIKFLRGEHKEFQLNTYDEEAVKDIRDEIDTILRKRQVDSCDDWQAFGQKLSGQEVPDFNIGGYEKEYMEASEEDKQNTWMGQFLQAAVRQKAMVTNRIHKSGSTLAGFSIEAVSGAGAIAAAIETVRRNVIGEARSGMEDAQNEIQEAHKDAVEQAEKAEDAFNAMADKSGGSSSDMKDGRSGDKGGGADD